MDETILTLKNGVTLTERDGQTGLMLHVHTRFAKDKRQSEILRALVAQPRSLENLMKLLRERDGSSKSDNDNSLTIAEFILDFGEYIKA